MKSEIAKRYWNEYGLNMSKKGIARLMYAKEYPVFADTEDARISIRYASGAMGEKNRKHLPKEEHVIGVAHPTNPYQLPDSDESDWTPFILGESKYGLLSDVHLPYHNIRAVSASIDYFLKNGVENIILNGDTLDCYKQSRFEIDPRKRNFSEERETWFEFVEALQNVFSGKVVFKQGNHEERYNKYIVSRAPELLGINEFSFESVMRFQDYEVDYVSEKRPMYFGDLTVLHGHEYTQSTFSPVNVARGLFLRAKSDSLCGHSHQTSQHQEANVRGKQTVTYSVGCLCELHPAYSPLNKWNHGAAIISREGSEFEVDNFRINENGRVHK